MECSVGARCGCGWCTAWIWRCHVCGCRLALCTLGLGRALSTLLLEHLLCQKLHQLLLLLLSRELH